MKIFVLMAGIFGAIGLFASQPVSVLAGTPPTCSGPSPEPIISNCNFQPKLSPASVVPGDTITLTFQQGWCGGVGPNLYFNVPGKFISYEGGELGTVDDRISGVPVVRFPNVPDAGVTKTYVQRTVRFRVSADLKDWTGVKTCPRALKYYEPPNSDTGPYLTINEGGHDYLPFTVTLPKEPPLPKKPSPYTPSPDDLISVAKIVSIRTVRPDNPSHFTERRAPSTKLEIFRDGKWSTARDDMNLHIGDKLRTDEITETSFEFAIGGMIGIKKDSFVIVTGENSASGKEDASNRAKILLDKGAAWAKCQKLSEPLEIQTNGGVMGIKG